MTLGLIARADNGGLGAQTWDAWRHLQPAKTLVVHTAHKTRGRAHIERYPNSPDVQVRCTHAEPSDSDIDWLLDGSTTLFSVETWYTPRLLEAASKIRTVLLANPEMHDHSLAGSEVWCPTDWRRDLVPENRGVLPAPVDRELLPFRQRIDARVLYHVASPAFHDRNGTLLVLEAVAQLPEPCQLLIRGGDHRPGRERIGRCTVDWLPHHDGPYWEHWPDEADLLVLPRRFGGLSLPMQEAASLGLPIVTLNVEPQGAWPTHRVKATVGENIRVKGGRMDVHSCAPAQLASALAHLLDTPDDVASLSALGHQWAESISWGNLANRYLHVLGEPDRALPAGRP